MTGFQSHVNNALPVAVEGDFASTNPRASVVSGAGALTVAAGQTVRVGYFAWAGADGQVYSSQAAADATGVSSLGFVGRQANAPNAVITTFLGESVMVLNAGMPCTLFSRGDFWANFAAGIPIGNAVYATAATGQPAATDGGGGTNPISPFTVVTTAVGPVVTAATSTIAAQTGVLTVLTVASGGNNIQVGAFVGGSTLPTASAPGGGVTITAQLSGTVGGAGTYQTTYVNRAAVAAFAATVTQGTLAKISSSYTAGG